MERAIMLKLFIVLALALALTPFAASYRLKADDSANISDFLNSISKNVTISLDQFDVLMELGEGAFASTYLVRKRGGSDDGKLYAMKASMITVAENNERDVLIALSGKKEFVGLHYAWVKGKWAFLVIDFVDGGNMYSRHKKGTLVPSAMKLALAEVIDAAEKMHKMNIRHGDLGLDNTVITSDGHTKLIDFGQSEPFSDDDQNRKEEKREWDRVSIMCQIAFPKPIHADEHDLIELLRENMTDSQLPELKNLQYFDGIDWEKVADRTSDPPFEPITFELTLDDPLDITTKLRDDGDYSEHELRSMAMFSNYSYVAPEHQN